MFGIGISISYDNQTIQPSIMQPRSFGQSCEAQIGPRSSQGAVRRQIETSLAPTCALYLILYLHLIHIYLYLFQISHYIIHTLKYLDIQIFKYTIHRLVNLFSCVVSSSEHRLSFASDRRFAAGWLSRAGCGWNDILLNI